MTKFLTVKEAAQLTGKSSSSIRRVIYPIIQSDSHPDRQHIQPSVEEALKLRMKGENFPWRLSEELLRREVPTEPASGKPHCATRPAAEGEAELLAMLRRELDIKNAQITQHGQLIAKQMELISGLSERLREGNILIGSLQQRLALTDGRNATPPESVKVKRSSSTAAEKGSSVPPKTPKLKKSFFARLFNAL